jgi:hypothetical protein
VLSLNLRFGRFEGVGVGLFGCSLCLEQRFVLSLEPLDEAVLLLQLAHQRAVGGERHLHKGPAGIQ